MLPDTRDEKGHLGLVLVAWRRKHDVGPVTDSGYRMACLLVPLVTPQQRLEVGLRLEPRAGWDRWYRMGVEFPTRDNNLGMATLNLPRERYDALQIGDTVAVHYFPAFPLLARAADRATLQAIGHAGVRVLDNPSVMPSVAWMLVGVVALWMARWIATPVIVATGLAWMTAGLVLLFPPLSPPPSGPATAKARVTAVNLITKAPARNRSRRHRAAGTLGDQARRLAMPYQVVQLRFSSPGHPDSTLAVNAVDSGSVAGLQVGAELPSTMTPGLPGTRSWRWEPGPTSTATAITSALQ